MYFQKLTCFPAWAPEFTPEREKPEDVYLRIRYALIDNQLHAEADNISGGLTQKISGIEVGQISLNRSNELLFVSTKLSAAQAIP